MDDTYSQTVLMDGVRHGNSLILAVVAGLAAALICSLMWVGISMITGPECEYLALGVAFLVGVTVRLAGNGSRVIYGVIGALLTLISSVAGDMVAVIVSGTNQHLDFYGMMAHVNLIDVLTGILDKATQATYLLLGLSLVLAYMLSIQKAK